MPSKVMLCNNQTARNVYMSMQQQCDLFRQSYFQVSCHLRMPATSILPRRSIGSSCQTGKMAALSNSLLFVFKISFLPKYRVMYYDYTVVPALGDPRRERPPAVYGRVINVPRHFNVKLPVIGGHLPNADADSHLLVVRTCYNGQCKQMCTAFSAVISTQTSWLTP